MSPKVHMLRFGNEAPITLIECFSVSQYQEFIRRIQSLVLMAPHGVYLSVDCDTVRENGVLLLPCGEVIALYTGGALRTPKDIVIWSQGFSAQVCVPADFNL